MSAAVIVTLFAFAAVILSYGSLLAASLRSRDEPEQERAQKTRSRVRVHMAVIVAATVVVAAAQPWGPASLVAIPVLVVILPATLVHVALVAHFVGRRRERRRGTSSGRPEGRPEDVS